ncbi:MAG TPA: 3-oxoacyl-[acyl-carrier-protein] synthase III C-terminal domain-containing protein [Verrucomicrobiae bacterium]
MFIAGLGTAVPAHRYTQEECWQAFQSAEPFARLPDRSRAILRKVLSGSNGIATRHFSVSPLSSAFEITPDVLHQRFATAAPALCTEAALKASEDARVTVEEIDAVVISTCTGYLCPGLTSYVSERLGLRANVLALDLVGQGCGAAIPNLRTCETLLASGRAKQVLSICVEVCSAALYVDDDPGVLISNCLFGDGAGAAVVSAEAPAHQRCVEWLDADTVLSAADRDYLRFEQRHGLLRNILARQVPGIAAKFVEEVLTTVLARNKISKEQIAAWILHPGGRDILRALQERLVLREEDLKWSASVLHDYGNISSASLYFVMQRALSGNEHGGWWWLSSFGAGFSCHGALVKVEG